MEYLNSETGVRVNLDSLTPAEKKFYKLALKKFQENTNGDHLTTLLLACDLQSIGGEDLV
jgi:hypothetical protein